jgi:hypothetical protein
MGASDGICLFIKKKILAKEGSMFLWSSVITPHDHVPALKAVITKQNMNSKDSARLCPVEWAIQEEAHKILDFLIEMGADVQIKKKWNKDSMLHYAVKVVNQIALQTLIDTKRIPVDVRNGDGETPLHCAIVKDCDECVRLLLSAGANPRRVLGRTNQTCLDLALAQSLDFSLVKRMILAGAWFQRITGRDRPLHWRAYRQGLANCKLAERALGRVLKLCKVDKDSAAVIQRMVWETHDAKEWEEMLQWNGYRWVENTK